MYAVCNVSYWWHVIAVYFSAVSLLIHTLRHSQSQSYRECLLRRPMHVCPVQCSLLWCLQARLSRTSENHVMVPWVTVIVLNCQCAVISGIRTQNDRFTHAAFRYFFISLAVTAVMDTYVSRRGNSAFPRVYRQGKNPLNQFPCSFRVASP